MNTGPVIAGNWKMNMTPDETRAFFQGFSFSPSAAQDPQFLIFPPYLSLAAALEALPAHLLVSVGIQNLYWEASGAFTGEVSAPMARAAGATHTLVGHSERRHVFGESNEEVAWKVSAALAAGLIPVVCVGETIEERREGRLEEVILAQLNAVLPILEENPEGEVLLAYEPVWAIGTGETATPQDASQAHGVLRERLTERLGPAWAQEIPILYGGSVKPDNAGEILRAPEVDGVLVGGASLDPDSFRQIAEAV
ncbi:triose-phosphate isomerase [Gemmatimonadota bacterium]